MKNSEKTRVRTRKAKKPYADRGYLWFARIWLGGDLAQFPSAFMLYVHLFGWANHIEGNLGRGQVALGERDIAERLGLSITTLRKWLRWLCKAGWIGLEPTRYGRVRGSIITVLRYTESQTIETYTKTTSEDQKMILTPFGSQDQKMILTSLSEDQKMILKGLSEDQKMIPHDQRLIRSKGVAQRHSPTKSQGGDEGERDSGLALSGEQIHRRARMEVEALCNAAAASEALEKKRPVGTGARARTAPKLEGDGPKPLEGARPA